METFAIVRQDGEVDKVEGFSVADVAWRYGWPGNGTIEPWDDTTHKKALRHTLSSPEQQRELLADAPADTTKKRGWK